MLKVLQICNKAPYPANDGSSIAIFNMARGLLANDVSVRLLTINTKKHFKPDNEVPKDFVLKTGYTSVYRNTNTSFTGAAANLLSTQSYFVSRFYFRRFASRLKQILEIHQFDVIQLEGLFMAAYIPLIRKHSKAKVVLRAHNIEHLIWQRHLDNSTVGAKAAYLKLQTDRLKKFELKVLSQVDAIVPITRSDEELLKKLGFKKPIYTCITGLDLRQYQHAGNVKTKPRTVFCFGSMDWLPNQEAALWFVNKCWDKIHEAVPDARLVIAGKGMPLSFFQINKPNIAIVDSVEDARSFFLQHQVMVVPLQSGSGLRIKIVEGMAYGKAIVSTSIGAEGIRYTDRQNIIIADAADDFALSVIRLLQDPTICGRIEKNAAEFARKNFDNVQVVAGLVAFYKKLLNG